MLRLRLVYLLSLIFCTWLALATRSHPKWFFPVIAEYGGDVIWSGMFLFLLRCIFLYTALWKLALINYALGVLDEFSQLSHAAFFVAIRRTYVGRLIFGVGFLWSDILCYAVGTLIAWTICLLIDKFKPSPSG